MNNLTLLDDRRLPRNEAEELAQKMGVRIAIGGRLRKWRERADIPLELAEARLGVSLHELLSWECGSVSPKFQRFFILASQMNATTEADNFVGDFMLQADAARKAHLSRRTKREWANVFDALGVACRRVA